MPTVAETTAPTPRKPLYRISFDDAGFAAGALHQLAAPLVTPPPRPVRRSPFRTAAQGALESTLVAPDTYGTGLAAAYAVVRQARSPSTHSLRHRVNTAFQQFLARLPAGLHKTFITATAQDVMVFLQAEWRPHHGRTRLLDGTLVASASGLSNAIAALNACFVILGRRGEWDPHTNQGNPCESPEVRLFRSGYQQELRGEAVEPIAATPLGADKLLALVVDLDSRREALLSPLTAESSPFVRLRGLLLERDALLFTYLGASIQRGGEGARLRMCDVRSAQVNGVTGVSLPLGNAAVTDSPVSVSIHPNGVKTRQRRNCGHFALEPHADPRLCFIRRLAAFVGSCRQVGCPLQLPGGFIFRVMDPHDRHRLAEAPLTVSAGLSRLRAALDSLGTYHGESMHSFRRAGMQSDQSAGLSAEATMKRALIVSTSSYNLYTNRQRPTKALRYLPSGS